MRGRGINCTEHHGQYNAASTIPTTRLPTSVKPGIVLAPAES